RAVDLDSVQDIKRHQFSARGEAIALAFGNRFRPRVSRFRRWSFRLGQCTDIGFYASVGARLFAAIWCQANQRRVGSNCLCSLRKLGSFHRVVIYKDLSAACVIASPTIAVPQLVAQKDCWIASFGFDSLVAEYVDMTAPFFILIGMGTRIARPTGL